MKVRFRIRNESAGPSLLPQDHARRVPAGRADDTAAGMCRGATEEQPLDRGPVASPADDGTQEEQLVQGHLPLEDVAAGQAVDALDVHRAENLPGNDRALESRGVLFEDVEAAIGE